MSSRFYILALFGALALVVAVRDAFGTQCSRPSSVAVQVVAPEEPSLDETELDLAAEAAGEEAAADSGQPAGEEVPDDETAGDKRAAEPRLDREQQQKPEPKLSFDSLLPAIDDSPRKPSAPMPTEPPYRWLDENYVFLNEADPYLPGTDPFREWPGVRVGWFAGVELTAARPSIHSEITSSTLGPGDFVSGSFANTFQLPVANLEWFAMPKVYVGYRRENGLGEFLLGYRFIDTDGKGTIANFDAAGAGQLSSKLQAHVIDLDYGWTDVADGLPWYLPQIVRRTFGLRAASVVFDSSAAGAQILEEREGNVFVGAGPRVNFDGTWPTAIPSLAFIGGVDASAVIGFNYQRYGETALVGGNLVNGSARTDGTTSATPILRVQAGLSWVPEWRNGTTKFSAGYQWERWWVLTDTTSQVEITLQGPFVRAELRW